MSGKNLVLEISVIKGALHNYYYFNYNISIYFFILVEKWMDRVKELEMELAQTKLALVETKCRNQELTHQIAVHEESSSQSATAASSSNKKWFAKTLYSIKESAVASSGFNSKPTSSITKSTSVDVLKSLPEND